MTLLFADPRIPEKLPIQPWSSAFPTQLLPRLGQCPFCPTFPIVAPVKLSCSLCQFFQAIISPSKARLILKGNDWEWLRTWPSRSPSYLGQRGEQETEEMTPSGSFRYKGREVLKESFWRLLLAGALFSLSSAPLSSRHQIQRTGKSTWFNKRQASSRNECGTWIVHLKAQNSNPGVAILPS